MSVYIKIKQIFPDVRYLYFLDNEGFPYSEKSESFILKRIICIINAVLKRHELHLVIIACNTASIVALSFLRKLFIFPIVGIFPAIKLAAKLTSNGIVGLLATCVTINSSYVISLINKYSDSCNFLCLGSSELVKLVEDKKYGNVVKMSILRKILSPWLKLVDFPDVVVLGCTHFTFLHDDLRRLFSDNTKLIDSFTDFANFVIKIIYSYVVNHNVIIKMVKEDLLYYSIFTDRIKQSMLFMNGYGFRFFEVISV